MWDVPSSTKNGVYYHIIVRRHTFLQLFFDAGVEDGDEETRHNSAHHLTVSTREISNNVTPHNKQILLERFFILFFKSDRVMGLRRRLRGIGSSLTHILLQGVESNGRRRKW